MPPDRVLPTSLMASARDVPNEMEIRRTKHNRGQQGYTRRRRRIKGEDEGEVEVNVENVGCT